LPMYYDSNATYSEQSYFFLLGLLHVYWALGGKWAVGAVIPTNTNGRKLFNPGSLGTLIVALGLLLFMMTDLNYSGLIAFDFSKNITRYGILGICIIFLMRAVGDFNNVGFTKQRTQSEFAKMDTRFYSPLCLFIAITHCQAYWNTV
jgi:hypothetical protein